MHRHVLEKLEADHRALKSALLVDIPKEIAAAASQGDLSENADYELALSKRDMFQAKMVALEHRISEIASMNVTRLPKDEAAYGSRVRLLDLDTEKEVTYRLVLPEELGGDPELLSISSPIGYALLGKREGDDVLVKIPSGAKRFEVLDLQTVHQM
jgi:transcription elongation factor GreA